MSDSLESRVLALVRAEPSIAARAFAMQIAQGVTDDEVNEALLSAAGIDPDAPEGWPLDDITYDHYDSSFEFKDVRPDWKPTPEALKRFWALGFVQCWICYTDWGETHYSENGRDSGYYTRPEDNPRNPEWRQKNRPASTDTQSGLVGVPRG